MTEEPDLGPPTPEWLRTKTLKVLARARELVGRGWTTVAFARDPAGEDVDWNDPDACAWCLYGAISRAASDLETLCTGAHDSALEYAGRAAMRKGFLSVGDYNDRACGGADEADELLLTAMEDVEKHVG